MRSNDSPLVTCRGFTFSPAPSRVARHLYQGALGWSDTVRAASSGNFDLVVSCAKEIDMPPLPPGVAHYTLRLTDEPKMSEAEFQRVLRAAGLVHAARRRGKRALVACAMGLNRSGLVTGLALRLAGLSGTQAVHAVRASRGNFALSNDLYRRIVQEYRPPEVMDTR